MSESPKGIPAYKDLPIIQKTGAHHNWGVFGDTDELGAINFLTQDRVKSAAKLVHDGFVVSLSLPLDLPKPQLARDRAGYAHHIERRRSGGDDKIDNFYLQGSTQWDGLGHVRYREFGYYGGREDEDLDKGELGIDRWAEHGIVGRGVLIDLPEFASASGRTVPPNERHGITPPELEEILSWEHTKLEGGDILLVRTGWLSWYLSLDDEGRNGMAGRLHNEEGGMECPGLDPAEATAAWLWNNQVPAIAADNPALEALVVRKEEGFLHRLILPLLGMAVGEFWNLEGLSAACKSRRRYEFLFVSAPLNIPNGLGSPGNGIAIF